MKLKKYILYTVGILVLVIAISGFAGNRYINNRVFKERPNYFHFQSELKPFEFEWIEETYGDYHELHAASESL